MKTLRNPLLWLALGAMLLCYASVFSGCATLPQRPPQTVAIDSLKTTYSVAREAYRGVVTLYVQGKVKDADMKDIDKAWNDFRAGMTLAVRAASQDWTTAPSTDSVLKLKDDLFTLIRSL